MRRARSGRASGASFRGSPCRPPRAASARESLSRGCAPSANMAQRASWPSIRPRFPWRSTWRFPLRAYARRWRCATASWYSRPSCSRLPGFCAAASYSRFALLQKNFYFLARRFVAGETIDSAIEAVRELNGRGMSATLDFLGEDVSERDAAVRTRDVYLEMLDAIRDSGVDSNVSVKLTAIGLLIDEDFAFDNLLSIVERAQRNPDPFVRIDMEGSSVLVATLRIFERAFSEHRNVGPVLQAYLKRTAGDVERAIELGARVRLCKGAYNEPAEIAYKNMPEIRTHYLEEARALLERGTYPGIATHDRRLMAAVKAFVTGAGI